MSRQLLHHPDDGSKHLLDAMADQELVQDALARSEDVANIVTYIKPQLWWVR